MTSKATGWAGVEEEEEESRKPEAKEMKQQVKVLQVKRPAAEKDRVA